MGDAQIWLPHPPRTALADGHYPYPVELRIPGVQIVGMAVCGWSVWFLFLVKNIPSCIFAA